MENKRTQSPEISGSICPPEDIDSSWKGVESVIRVTRSGELEGKEYSTLSYYFSSLPPMPTNCPSDSWALAARKSPTLASGNVSQNRKT
ncbi:MAG: hypothetical protein ACKPCM_13680 [Pseudanabaena sp.]